MRRTTRSRALVASLILLASLGPAATAIPGALVDPGAPVAPGALLEGGAVLGLAGLGDDPATPTPLIRAWDAEVEAAMMQAVPELETGIGPGSALRISGLGGGDYLCTANFVWTDDFDRLYLGTAGHCVLPADKTATHGPGADFDASGVKVGVRTGSCPVSLACGASSFVPLGPVVYAREDGVGNDFAIISIPETLRGEVRDQMPVWGGPTGEGTIGLGETVLFFGQGLAVGEAFATRGRAGIGLGGSSDWSAIGPVNSGDSGSAAVSGGAGVNGGNAIGVITHSIGAAGFAVPSAFFGTQIETAKRFVGEHIGLRIWTLPGGAPLPDLPQPEPDQSNVTLPAGPVHIQLLNNESKTHKTTYTWMNEWQDVRVLASIQTTNGSAQIEIRDEANATLAEVTSLADIMYDRTLSATSTGTWTIQVTFQEHVGALALRIEQAATGNGNGNGNGSGNGNGPGNGSGNGNGNGASDGTGNETLELGDGDKRALPAAGLFLLVIVAAGALLIARRRRGA